MTKGVESQSDAFVAWVKKASDQQLKELAVAIEDELDYLEAEDYFGTEGINKRFA